MEINRIETLIKKAAAGRNAVYEENGNAALQAQQSVKEPVIPLPNTQPMETKTFPASAVQPSRREVALAYIKEHFIEGRHILKIPGVAKPVLTKIGAYALLNVMQLRETIEIVDITILPEVGFISYTVCCQLTDLSSGAIITSALGAANTQEAKFQKSGLSAQHLFLFDFLFDLCNNVIGMDL